MVDPTVELLEQVLRVIALLAAGLAIPFGVCVIYSLFKRRWREALIQIAIPVITFAALALAFLSIGAWERSRFCARLYGTDAETGQPLFQHISPRGFGDGYTFAVYPMPAAIRGRFATADVRQLSQYPEFPKDSPDQRVQHWKRAPLSPESQEHVGWALNPGHPGSERALLPFLKEARDALSRPDVYYAFRADISHGYPGEYLKGIDFFIVDLQKERLYVIYHKT